MEKQGEAHIEPINAVSEPYWRTKAVQNLPLARCLGVSQASTYIGKSGSKSAVKFKAALNLATSLLISANSLEVRLSDKPTETITTNTAKVSAKLTARTIAQFTEQQKQKTESGLDKTQAGFLSVWQKVQDKKVLLNLVLINEEAQLKVKSNWVNTNAKVTQAIVKLVCITKARFRKAESISRVKTLFIVIARLIEVKAAMKADLVAV